MNRGALGIAACLMLPLPAAAADPVPPGSAFYVGGHAGYGFGNVWAMLSDPPGPGGQTAGGTGLYGSAIGGLQAGYEHYFPSRLMLGLEIDFSGSNYKELSQSLSYRANGNGEANEQLEYLATLRARLGWAMGHWTPFLTGGAALASTRFSRIDSTTANEDAQPGNLRWGYVLGIGVDRTIDRRWSARLEYLRAAFGASGYTFASTGTRYDSQFDLNILRAALNYRFGQPGEERGAEPAAEDRGPGSWEIHGQSTFIFQGYPAIRAPYDGPNSLPGVGQARETWTISAFLGLRLWQGGELYFNPELLQGFGVAGTTGAGGYPNGEAQKSNFPFPRFNASRYFLRQELGLGGEREKVESDYGQLAGERDVSRVTVQVGKFAVHDIFDGNSYAEDPRVDFLNWSIWAAGAFDYPADRVGLTYGISAELNQPWGALRAGYFLVGNEPNSTTFDMNLFSRGGYVAELELRYKPGGRPGAAKLGAWFTNTFAGAYADAVALASQPFGPDINSAIVQSRTSRIKSGLYLNIEQELSDALGAFGRLSWNDGRSEISAFTDIDTSFSLGFSLKGVAWGRPDDRVGLAGAVNMLSDQHRAFLAAGGLGVLVGDGQLNYAPETVVETYYALQLFKGLVATLDYQLLVNPAYNADRGPAHVFSGRLHASF